MTILAVFRSRSRAVRFFEALRRNGIGSHLLNTPRGITPYCSVSVRLARADYEDAKIILDHIGTDSFVGFY